MRAKVVIGLEPFEVDSIRTTIRFLDDFKQLVDRFGGTLPVGYQNAVDDLRMIVDRVADAKEKAA